MYSQLHRSRSGETSVASAEIGLTAMRIVEDAYRVAGFSTARPKNSD
jgi:hypothetical protein